MDRPAESVGGTVVENALLDEPSKGSGTCRAAPYQFPPLKSRPET